jgi:3-dehydroquinate dehydratase-2
LQLSLDARVPIASKLDILLRIAANSAPSRPEGKLRWPMATSRRNTRSSARRPTSEPPERSILVLHGPNLDLLGAREPAAHGGETLAQVDARLVAEAARRGVRLVAFQSNYEGALIDRVHAAGAENVAFMLVNPAGLTHTSVSLRDALTAVAIPFIEVHLTNVHAREPFRRRSYFSDVAVGSIAGLGSRGYDFALAYALARIGG